MLLTMGVSLYTVRVVLNTLGIVDYGIYNVVGGIVTLFAFLSNTMASASQRYFAFEIGRKDFVQLRRIFSLTIFIYVIIALIVFILAQTIGLWFLNNKMIIPEDRYEAANWVYQFSVLSFLMYMFTIPYNALIVARERMNVYAWVSIIEVSLKLFVVFLLVVLPNDKLKIYSILMFGVTTVITLVYRLYCKNRYDECRYLFYWDKRLFIEMIKYSGWNIFGVLSGVLKIQGVNILLNIYFGPIVNAARGISVQVNDFVNQFVINFFKSFEPQITKYYASGDYRKMLALIFSGSKISFFILFILSVPFLIETEYIFGIWLSDVPEYTIVFSQLLIVNSLIDSLSYSLTTAVLATGKIKKFQLIVGGILLLNLPFSLILMILGSTPQSTLYVSIILSIICFYLRMWILSRLISFDIKSYISEVLFRVILVVIIVVVLFSYPLSIINFGAQRFLLTTISSFIITTLLIYKLGLNRIERKLLNTFVFESFKKKVT